MTIKHLAIKHYVAIQDSDRCAKGTHVYDSRGYDYGLSSDDTRHTGVEHVSVSLSPDGDYPFVTVPVHTLQVIE
jgi:hypothetical protein